MSEAEWDVHKKPKRRCDCCATKVEGYWVCGNCHGDCGDGMAFEALLASAWQGAMTEAIKRAEKIRASNGEVNERDPYDIAWDVACNEIIEQLRAAHNEGKG